MYRLGFDVCVVDVYSMCVGDRSMVEARRVFNSLADHNIMDWTAIITGYAQSGGQDREAIELYCKMIEGQVLPNHVTFQRF